MKTRPIHPLLLLAFAAMTSQASAQSFKGVALPPEVNTAYDETQPRLSPDDSRLYFVRAQHPENQGGRGGGQDIWYSELQPGGGWSTAKNIGTPLNDALHNHVGAVTNGGRTLFLGSGNTNAAGKPVPGLSTSTRPTSPADAAWPSPTPLFTHPLGSMGEGTISFTYHPGTEAFVCAWVEAPGKPEDLFVILPKPSGGWMAPKPLGSQVNTSGTETAPFIGQDGRTLYFSSNGRGGQGKGDIFVTRRMDDTWTNWSDPVNLGPEVNTAGFDAHFIVDSQGANGYFMSGPTPTSLGDIYSIPLKDIAALRPPLAESDTLRIFTTMNTSIPFSLDAYNVPAERATLVSPRAINGEGKVIVSRNAPHFSYQPAPGFVGKEAIQLTYCDPPESDDCNEIIVLAEVKGDKPATAPMVTMRTQTRQNTPVNLNVPESTLRMADMIATRMNAKPGDGKLKIDFNEGRDQLAYFPVKDFTGLDTVYLYRPCSGGNPVDCRLAQVIVDVLPPEIAVVVPPVVKDTVPAVVVVVPPVVKDTVPAVVVVVPPVVKDTVPATVVVVDPGLPKDVLIKGRVIDEVTRQPLAAEIEFISLAGKPLGTISSNAQDGTYGIRLPMAEGYTMKVDKRYYFPVTDLVNVGKGSLKGEVNHDVVLAPIPMEVGQTFVLKDIYFDLDKSTLKPESRAELQRLYQLLMANPTMEIEIRGHTDNWSSDAYNITLSNNRSNAVVNYLKYMGVKGTRLSWKGFGEANPIATNETDEGRALNRRVEFVILKM